ncbi:hypothetical protein R2A130_3335 [Ahrensia sp. R2A130]|nr:hypothetical protein R2A130_3335 [Ahrensia sp. R2A130]
MRGINTSRLQRIFARAYLTNPGQIYVLDELSFPHLMRGEQGRN